jgi:hypothetical protein
VLFDDAHVARRMSEVAIAAGTSEESICAMNSRNTRAGPALDERGRGPLVPSRPRNTS